MSEIPECFLIDGISMLQWPSACVIRWMWQSAGRPMDLAPFIRDLGYVDEDEAGLVRPTLILLAEGEEVSER